MNDTKTTAYDHSVTAAHVLHSVTDREFLGRTQFHRAANAVERKMVAQWDNEREAVRAFLGWNG